MEFHPSYYSADFENAISNNVFPKNTVNVSDHITHGHPSEFSYKNAVQDTTRPVNCGNKEDEQEKERKESYDNKLNVNVKAIMWYSFLILILFMVFLYL